MTTAILTDSTCDLSQKTLDEYGIEVVPLSVHFAEDEYQDGVEINPDSFFKQLKKSKTLPHTSRPSVGLFLEKYKKLLQNYDQIISIHVSAALSGTYESAKLAAQELEAGIKVIDSASISLGLGMLVVLAAKLIREKKSTAALLKTLKKAKENLSLYFTVKDLKYMEKGGRIGKAASFLGSILNINPIISISTGTGKVKPITKLRGKRRAQDKLIKIISQKIGAEDNFWLAFAHGDRKKDLKKMKNKLLKKLKSDSKSELEIFNSRISATLGSHVGPTVYAVFLLKGDFLNP